MVAITKDRFSYQGAPFVPNNIGGTRRKSTKDSFGNFLLPQRGIRFFPKMPEFPQLPQSPPLPKKPYLPPKLYRRPDVKIQEESQASYKEVIQGLTELGATPHQIEIWRDSFVSLEEKGFLTNEFSRGFIELVKAKATDIELDSFSHTAELLITASNGKASLDSLIVRYLDVVQRKDLSERTRRRLLSSEQVKVIKDTVKNGKLNIKDILSLGLRLGIKLIMYLLGKVI